MRVFIIITVDFTTEVEIPDTDEARGTAAAAMRKGVHEAIASINYHSAVADYEIAQTQVWPLDEHHPNNQVGEPLWEEDC